ncbi:hypothetical protein [Brumimicrobium aurantiacum]|uniref:Lipoprotein n=1 Tax=Brumimicrobium aurantiacum TaxID=1737063 RepID=A0A3E1EUQ3_9FLAO|nr:hypothetical protein [Brumimicrobium aurantiacum]RFC53294.1 hypothetical protein DXU93_13915 [Brumimicrobium aurantiacum]
MKKVLFVGLLFGGLALTSCKKEYTCECATSSNMPGASEGSTSVTIEDKKKDAEDACEAMSTSVSSGEYTTTTDCEIK